MNTKKRVGPKIFFSLFLVFFVGNAFSQEPISPLKKIILFSSKSSSLFLKKLGAKCNVSMTGHVVKIVSGHQKGLLCFKKHWTNFKNNKSLSAPSLIGDDFILKVERPASSGPSHEKAFYLAKKDFNLPKFWKTNEEADGRGVIVGVIDDGISPLHKGFQKTTTGKRKILAHFSNSTGLQFQLKATNIENIEKGYLPSKNIEKFWTGLIKEEKDYIGTSFIDLNRNKKKDDINAWVFQSKEKKVFICIDSNQNKKREKQECFRSFNQTGEYGYWDENKQVALLAEFDQVSEKIIINEGEDKGDSHGEGVASVMAGHLIADRFNGVAPGAQILDYDLGEPSSVKEESFYTFSTFLKALDTLGKEGAEVINISYSFYFLSEKNQNFMKKALEELIKTYNFVLCFSAGNNGPGLTSLNRRGIYPDNALVVGAFAGKELYEKVHGVSGIPKQGRLAYYSSRGPGPKGGNGPSLIAPLASLVYSTSDRGLRAFSGTSSASPAAAGLVAVFISALKKESLPIKASTIVAALKYSGIPLKETPFIAQGYGLPQIDRAIPLYKKMIEGNLFKEIKTDITIPFLPNRKGLFFKTSELREPYIEARLYLKGIPSATIPPHKKSEMFLPTKIEYSHPWIEGSKNGFLSSNYSSFSVGINLKEIKWPKKSYEIFGEIKIKEETTGQILHIIPITIIKDYVLNKTKQWSLSLNAEQGNRIHFHAPPSVKGIRITTNFKGYSTGKFGFKLYNSFGVKGRTIYPQNGVETILPILQSGYYQLGTFRSKGTKRTMKLNLTLSPLKIDITSKAILLKDSLLYLDSKIEKNLRGKIIIKNKAIIKSEKFVEFKGSNSFALETSFSPGDLGSHQVKLTPLYPNSWTYPRESCFSEIKTPQEKVILTSWGPFFRNTLGLFKEKLKEASKIQFYCRFFDSFKKENFTSPFLMTVEFRKNSSNIEKEILLKPGKNIIAIKKELLNNYYKEVDIFFSPSHQEGDDIFLGGLPLY
jgi:subtilisin family serine protease